MLNRNKRPLYRLAAVILIMSLLACSSALAAADYFARYKYAFSPEALVAASAAVPPEGMNESAMDIYRLGYAAGFDQALGNNVVFTNDGGSPFIAYPVDGGESQALTRAFTAIPTAAPQTYILNKKSQIFHLPVCSGAQSMSDANKIIYVGSRDEIIAMGYKPCQNCWP